MDPARPERSSVAIVWIESTTASFSLSKLVTAASTSVSSKNLRVLLLIPNLSALTLICPTDSSPDIYKVLPILSASWRRSVDLPIPGSPAIKTTCPGTSPPPKTLSSSEILVEILALLLDGIEERLIGLGDPTFLPLVFVSLESFEMRVSTRLPQEPQFGHLPAQPTWEYPHC